LNLIKKISTWLLSLALAFGCLIASHWQLDKGLKLTEKNRAISAAQNSNPISDPSSYSVDQTWQRFSLTGSFSNEYSLLRDQYLNGQYGFHVMQTFNSKTLGNILVDRGWVAAGKDAQTPPYVPQINASEDKITVRLRTEFLNTHPGGSLFAIPAKVNVTKKAYFDLLDSVKNKPLSEIDLPDLSTGPHYAYAIQWLFFALVVIALRVIYGKKSDSKSD
jgi:surfeit locus 1 family protein